MRKLLQMFIVLALVIFLLPGVVSAAENAEGEGWYWPVPSSKIISSNFGVRDGGDHWGLDISCVMGTPVCATKSGTISYYCNSYGSDEKTPGGWGMHTYGNYVVIQHYDGTYSIYAHLSNYDMVTSGSVAQGQVIAYSGDSGNSSGPHLHFQASSTGSWGDASAIINVMPTENCISKNGLIMHYSGYAVPAGWSTARMEYKFNVCSHSYSNIVTHPTCTAQGYTTHTCSQCGDSYVDTYTDATGHNYIAEVVGATCTTPGQTTYTCSKCGDSYVDASAGWSEWSTEYPTGISENLIEKKTQYSTLEKEYTTSTSNTLDGWTYIGGTDGEWGAVQTTTTKPTESDTLRITNTTQTGWGYYHWCSYYDGMYCLDSIQVSGATQAEWHGYTSSFELPAYTIADMGGQQSYGGNGNGAEPCSRNFYIWFRNYDEDVFTYSYQTREKGHHFYKWADEWSDWSDNEVQATEDLQVKTQTVFRYYMGELAAHKYTEKVTVPTCTEAGYTTHTCACGDSYVDTYIDATGHTYENGACTSCGAAAPSGDNIVASGTCGENVTWKLDADGTMTISGTGEMEDYEVVFLESPPHELYRPYGDYNLDIKAVVIEDGITNIGDFAFTYCGNLETISIPDSVISIGQYAFYYCASLKDVILPDNVAYIGCGAFNMCGITSISLPDKITIIEEQLFSCCMLTDIKLPENISRIGDEAFASSCLESVTIPAGVTEIGFHAFVSCRDLKIIWFEGDAPTIDETAFDYVTATAYYPAGNATWTEDVMLDYGGNITWVAEGDAAEEGIVDSGTCGENVTWKLDTEGTLTISGIGKIESYSFFDNSSIVSVIIEDGITGIGTAAFSECINLISVDIPDSVTNIGNWAFSDCSSLTSVVIPNDITSISAYTFFGCSSLSSVTIPDSVIIIGEGVFSDCSSLTSVNIPDSVTSLGKYAFSGCSNLISISIPDSVIAIGEFIFSGCSSLTSVIIPEGVTSIDWAFSYCTSLTSVAIPDSVVSIEGAFDNCTSLTSVTISKSLTNIGESAFYGCTDLIDVAIPDSVLSIEESAFYACNRLRSVIIPDSITSLGNYVFGYCESLTEVRFQGDAPEFVSATEYGNQFAEVTATVYYPVDNATWTEEVMQDYGGYLIWVPYCAHSNTTTNNAKDPECTETGYTGDIVCTACSKTVQIGEVIPALGHTEEAIPTIAATCTADGLTEGKQCTVCGTITVAQEIVPATGHTWDAGTVTTEPTETAQGEKTYTCTACSETKTEAIPMLDHVHSYTDSVTAPTCTEAGYTTHTCACGDSYHDNEVPAIGHSYQDGKCTACGEADPDWVSPAPKISRLAGAHRFDTAFLAADQMKATLGIEKFDTVVVASGMDFADALSGSYLAAVKNAPILLACQVESINDTVKAYIKENLNEGGTVYILGGENAVPASFETGLDGFAVERLAGANRFETNLLVLEEAGVGDKPILVATGLNFADCLSASAAKLPILLVYGNKLLDSQTAFLSEGRELYILGGTGAVSEALETQLKNHGTVERLAGGNRFETSVLIAEKFFNNPDTAVLAYAWNFPDGLCGGPLAATMNAPLILTMPKYEAQATACIQSQNIKNGIILGGETLIPETCVNTIFNLK